MRGRAMLPALAVALLVPALGALVVAQGDGNPIDAAPWTEGPVSDGHATLPDGVPYGEGRHLRVLLEVTVPESLVGMRDIPVVHTLDIAEVLRQSGYPSHAAGQLRAFDLVMDSFALVEVDSGDLRPTRPVGEDAAEHEPLLVFPGSFEDTRPFDARTNPTVTLQWVLRGASEGDRTYMLYFDTSHNGPKTPVDIPEADLGSVASAVGPGRGTRVYVPLHSNGIQAGQDPRSILVTNLQDGTVEVDIFLYDRSLPRSQPAQTMTLDTFGQRVEYRLSQGEPSPAALVEATGGLVMAEATSRVTDSSYVTGSSRLFVPSVDGGFTGRLFTAGSQSAMDWLVFCPSLPQNDGGCRVSFNGNPSQSSIGTGDFVRLSASAGQNAVLVAQEGVVAVQRTPPSATAASQGQRTLTLWPPLDGPVSASQFMGHALSDELRDKLLLMSHEAGTRVDVQSMVGARTRLTDGLDVGGPGLFTDSAGGGWGTGWDRDWRVSTDPTTPRDHEDGPARIRATAGGALSVASGSTAGGFSALMPLQSPDGGLHYVFQVPRDAAGNPLGKLVLFSIHDGTDVTATRAGPGGGGACCHVYPSLQAGERVGDLVLGGTGWWTVEASRPVVVAWQHVHQGPFSAYAPASTDVVDVQVAGVQSAGYLFDVTAKESLRSVRPGSSVEFSLDVRNLARTVDGRPIPDRIQITAQAPAGWPVPQVIPSVIEFDGTPEQHETARVSLRVPSDVDVSDGGATVTVRAQSSQEPRLEVPVSLGLNYMIHRGVLVTANGQPTEASATVAPGESANYTVRVTNTGSVPDRFLVQHESAPGGWSLEVLCIDGDEAHVDCLEAGHGVTPDLLPQQSAEYVFTVTADSPSSGRFPLRFLATSDSDPSVRGATRLVTSLDTDRDLKFLVNETTRVVEPGQQTTFHIVVRNDAEVEEELRMLLSPQIPDGWPEPAVEVRLAGSDARTTLDALGGVVPVPQLEEVDLWIVQAVPEDAAPRLLGLDTLTAEGRLAAGLSRSIDLRVVVAEVRGFEVEAPEDPVAAVPGRSVDLRATYHSLGNGPQSLRVEPVASGGTGWAFEDADGNSPPWNLTLPPRGSAVLDVRATVPRDAPAVPEGLPLALRSTVEGYPTVPVPVLLKVAAEPRVSAEPVTLRLDPGRDNGIGVPVTNTGNVPLRLRATWTDLPWDVEERSVELPVGASATLRFNVAVPAEAQPPSEARLVLSDPQAPLQDTTSWSVVLAQPALEARIVQMHPIASGAVVQVELTNSGSAPAYDVVVKVQDGDVVLDAVRIDEVRPGDTRVANLVAPADASAVEVVVSSADNPRGTALGLHGDPADRGAPAAGAVWLVSLLAVLVRRWRV